MVVYVFLRHDLLLCGEDDSETGFESFVVVLRMGPRRRHTVSFKSSERVG